MMNNQEEDKIILERVSKSDEKAFRELVHRYADFLFTYINSLMKEPERSEELVQDIFMQVWQSRETLFRIRSFKSYIFILSRNLALNAVKKRLFDKKQLKIFMEQVTIDQVQAEETRLQVIEEVIAQLPPQQHKVWVMARREGKKYNEIAQELQLSKETVKKYLQRATESIAHEVVKRMELIVILALYSQLKK